MPRVRALLPSADRKRAVKGWLVITPPPMISTSANHLAEAGKSTLADRETCRGEIGLEHSSVKAYLGIPLGAIEHLAHVP